MAGKILVNRAPVLTLWATVVAERLGYDRAEALTLAKAVAGLNAQSKGRRLGIFQPREAAPEAKKEQPAKKKQELVDLLGRSVPVVKTAKGMRATVKGEAVRPEAVQSYLESKFGDDLAEIQSAMQDLAGALKPADLDRRAFALYEEFRPAIPEGTKGWGARGELDPRLIRSLAKRQARA
jgi:hypothetical protein